MQQNTQYKKFNFNQLDERLNSINQDNETIQCIDKIKKASKSKVYILGIVFVVIGYLAIGDDTNILRTIAFILFFVFAFRAIGAFTKTKESYIKEDFYEFYKTNLLRIGFVPNDLQYEVLGYINTDHIEKVFDEAYNLQADAIINITSARHSSSKVSTVGLNVNNNISTKVEHHEHWTGTPIKIISDQYHNYIPCSTFKS